MTKRIVAALLAFVTLILSAAAIAGCSDEEGGLFSSCDDAANFPVTINGITIEKRPKAIVCTSPKLTDILIEVGAAKSVIGRPYQYARADVSSAAEVGTNDQPSLEIIMELSADLIIVDEMIPAETLTALQDTGIPVLQLQTPCERLGFRNVYACIGAATGGARDGQNKGLAKAESILINLDDIQRLVNTSPVSYVCIFTNSALTTYVTGDDITSMCIELAGGFNVAVEGSRGSFSLNEAAKGDPDVILCPTGSQPTVRSKRVLNTCSAVTRNRIYDYDVSKFDTCGSDLIIATWELARVLHPEIVTLDMMPRDAIDYYAYTSPVMTEQEYETMKSEEAEASAEQTYVFTYED